MHDLFYLQAIPVRSYSYIEAWSLENALPQNSFFLSLSLSASMIYVAKTSSHIHPLLLQFIALSRLQYTVSNLRNTGHGHWSNELYNCYCCRHSPSEAMDRLTGRDAFGLKWNVSSELWSGFQLTTHTALWQKLFLTLLWDTTRTGWYVKGFMGKSVLAET